MKWLRIKLTKMKREFTCLWLWAETWCRNADKNISKYDLQEICEVFQGNIWLSLNVRSQIITHRRMLTMVLQRPDNEKVTKPFINILVRGVTGLLLWPQYWYKFSKLCCRNTVQACRFESLYSIMNQEASRSLAKLQFT